MNDRGITIASVEKLRQIESIKGYRLDRRKALADRSGVSLEALNRAVDEPYKTVAEVIRGKVENRLVESEKLNLPEDYIAALKDVLKIIDSMSTES